MSTSTADLVDAAPTDPAVIVTVCPGNPHEVLLEIRATTLLVVKPVAPARYVLGELRVS